MLCVRAKHATDDTHRTGIECVPRLDREARSAIADRDVAGDGAGVDERGTGINRVTQHCATDEGNRGGRINTEPYVSTLVCLAGVHGRHFARRTGRGKNEERALAWGSLVAFG